MSDPSPEDPAPRDRDAKDVDEATAPTQPEDGGTRPTRPPADE